MQRCGGIKFYKMDIHELPLKIKIIISTFVTLVLGGIWFIIRDYDYTQFITTGIGSYGLWIVLWLFHTTKNNVRRQK
jgi:hypothetical protein